MGFILATFGRSVFFGKEELERSRYQEFREDFDRYLDVILKEGTIYIACEDQMPNFVLGYSIIEDHVLHFVFVKRDYRKNGIGTLLIKNRAIEDVYKPNMTKIGASIMQNHEDLFHLKKEDEHESNSCSRNESEPITSPKAN